MSIWYSSEQWKANYPDIGNVTHRCPDDGKRWPTQTCCGVRIRKIGCWQHVDEPNEPSCKRCLKMEGKTP